MFEKKSYRTQRSTSDINGIDPWIHGGTQRGVMARVRNILLQPTSPATVPEMLASLRTVKLRLPQIRRNSRSKSLFEASVFKDLKLVALVELERLNGRRP